MAREDRQLHIVMFPWLGFGHLLPFLELSKSLARRGHRISFVSAPRNIQRLPIIPPDLATLIDFIKFPLPHQEDLPPDAESTADVPFNRLQSMIKAVDGLSEPMAKLLETSSPDWVFYDFPSHWLPPMATKLGIRSAIFSVVCASFLVFIPASSDSFDLHYETLDDLTLPPKWMTFPTTIEFRLHEVKKMLLHIGENGPRLTAGISGCDLIIVRSCEEIEGNYLNLLKELHGKPVVPAGLLPPSVQERDGDDATWREISDWLKKHDKGSVVYGAFGSESSQTQEDITEVALGLEISGLPFIWVLRKSTRLSDGSPWVLPEGFEERTNGRGLVWKTWAPQLRILSHESVGGFLTHCGWSSVIEGLQSGQPLIMLPFFADQASNARVLAEMKVGIEIPRDEDDGSFTRNSVAESLRLVFVDEDRKIYREKAKESSALFGDRSLHGQYVDKLVEHLISNATE
ncbi:hypothetical protein Nepgr_003632 [Nepenthes gracilis]|uniref:Glycosyltransferase n=1 Tax=Nepenthes gracilis TaxID=150966 RepID=A0AAD3RZV3_NEPGR|nr:hypothetical protein Nepgr_003632 [Nepenthes gracilis]